MAFRLRPQAEADLNDIIDHIAKDSPRAALRWHEGILACCRRLNDMPGMGTARPEIRPELRMFPFGDYLILYQEASPGVDVVRVVHGARRWQDSV